MPKKKSKKTTRKPEMKRTISELQTTRDGGQFALSGYTYQLLYSCYLIILNCNETTTFTLEGIEDIDSIKQIDSNQTITHIQLKYSSKRQDASFLKDVLKNFLEVYLIDKNRNFKLVYDFEVARGNMSKLFSYNLDKTSNEYWKYVIYNIKKENSQWNWKDFSFADFISKLTFEKFRKNNLMNEIEKTLIKSYDITTDNIQLFCNGIKVYCLHKMETRENINKEELDKLIQGIKDDISKGPQNPAHGWIKRIEFFGSESDIYNNEYYEGKKATPKDIACQLPIRRPLIEKEIETSIHNNSITVIKASSGQGKTTMALQVAYNIKDEYTIYQLLWCNDDKELNHILQFFKSRVLLGEKPLILIDNLDSQSKEWNKLAQLLQGEVTYNYKLLLTTREDDWYNYSGDLSNIHSLQIIKLSLNEQEAELLYKLLYKKGQIHSSITDWHKAWVKVADRELLIEYVYLLTHGEMIADRIANQISQINRTESGRIKSDILRNVCFADICGVRLPVKTLIRNLKDDSHYDYGELLKSIKDEFLINIDESEKFVEGLHPVRSQHVVDILHQFIDIEETALNVVKIAYSKYLSTLFSNLPKFISRKNHFYEDIVKIFLERNDLASCVLAIKGLFSSSVMQYYYANKEVFDDADEHGGLFLISTELNPFLRIDEFDYQLNTLDKLQDIVPEKVKPNIQYLCKLRDSTPKIILSETDVYCFCNALYDELNKYQMFNITNDIDSYSEIVYWLYNIDITFNLTERISLEQLWSRKKAYSVDVITIILYTCFCANRDKYMNFVNANMETILSYLKVETQSIRIYVKKSNNSIHVEYILLPSNISDGNNESVSRIKKVCMAFDVTPKRRV